MDRVLAEFIAALRGSGLEPSLSEHIDAMSAVRLIGIDRREDLRECLGSTLAKSEDARTLFDETFDRFFRFEAFNGLSPTRAASITPGADAAESRPWPEQAGAAGDLLQMIEAGDAASLAGRLRKAELAAGLTSAWLYTQRGLYTRRILDAMGARQLGEEMSRLEQTPDGTDSADRIARLRRAQEILFSEVREHVVGRLALFGAAKAERMRDAALADRSLASIERRDFQRMHRLVRQLARKLATRHSSRLRRRKTGRLDFRRVLARSVPYGGLMFETHWKGRAIQKPRVIAICDVSRSVQAHARFLLLLLYSLRDVLPDLRSFAFTHRLVDISGHFAGGSPETAIEQVLHQVGGTGTNYGTMLADFAAQELQKIDRRTSVIFLGDARNNRADPRVDVLRTLRKRARRVIWLNPEPRSYWGLGDSEMMRYASCCHALHECSTLAQLERAIGSLLTATASPA